MSAASTNGSIHPLVQECLSYNFSSDFDNTNCIAAKLSSKNEELSFAIDFVFVLYATSLVFFMQSGFAMLCAGTVRKKNIQNTMLKNMLDACGAAIGFWSFGYAFAYSPSKDGEWSFIGTQHFLLLGLEETSYGFWLFQFAFAATATTIVAGTIAERCQMIAYMCYSVLLTGFVYPVVVRAIWSDYGFLSFSVGNLSEIGMIDFAGGGVVHVTGGCTALLLTLMLGPRKERFYDIRGKKLEFPHNFPPSSPALQVLGVFVLWFGWYGFNCGSMLTVSKSTSALTVGVIAMNTTLSAACGCVTALFTQLIITERQTGESKFDVVVALNGSLAGLVAITAGCATVDPWASVFIGVMSGWIYLAGSKTLVWACIDDVVDAIPVHLGNGIWGIVATGLFSTPTRILNVYGSDKYVGWFYEFSRGRADGTLLGIQLLGLLFIAAWVVTIITPFFVVLNFLGYLRADTLEEVVGLDISYHGGMYETTDINEMNEGYYVEYEKRRNRSLNASWSSRSIGDIDTKAVGQETSKPDEKSSSMNILGIGKKKKPFGSLPYSQY